MSITITLLIQGLAFFAVAWLVMQFGWPSIMSAIETRQKKIAEGLAAADRGQKDLDDARANAHEIVKEARNKATQIVDQANRRSNEMVEDAKGVAIAEGERLISVARADVSSEAGRARAALTQEVASLVVAGASQLLKREVDAKAHADLLSELSARITAEAR
jgi:F-type H+-transporting ATPase subunit b